MRFRFPIGVQLAGCVMLVCYVWLLPGAGGEALEGEEVVEVEVDVDGDDSASDRGASSPPPPPPSTGQQQSPGDGEAHDDDGNSEGSEHNAVCQNCGGVGACCF